MKAMAFKRIPVLDERGAADPKSYIASGDLCQIGGKTLAGLWPVTYPTSRGPKTRWLRELRGFLVNQNDFASVPYPAKGYEKATVKSGGCGVCAAVMAVGAVCGASVSVRGMAQYAQSWGARVPGGTAAGKGLQCPDRRICSPNATKIFQIDDKMVFLCYNPP